MEIQLLSPKSPAAGDLHLSQGCRSSRQGQLVARSVIIHSVPPGEETRGEDGARLQPTSTTASSGRPPTSRRQIRISIMGITLPIKAPLKAVHLASSTPAMAEEAGSPSPNDAVLFFGVSLMLGIVSRHLLRGTRIPYTVALLVLGVALGGLEYGTKHGLGKLGNGIRIWAAINPDMLLAVFLPALLFESSFSMEVHQIKMPSYSLTYKEMMFPLIYKSILMIDFGLHSCFVASSRTKKSVEAEF